MQRSSACDTEGDRLRSTDWSTARGTAVGVDDPDRGRPACSCVASSEWLSSLHTAGLFKPATLYTLQGVAPRPLSVGPSGRSHSTIPNTQAWVAALRNAARRPNTAAAGPLTELATRAAASVSTCPRSCTRHTEWIAFMSAGGYQVKARIHGHKGAMECGARLTPAAGKPHPGTHRTGRGADLAGLSTGFEARARCSLLGSGGLIPSVAASYSTLGGSATQPDTLEAALSPLRAAGR